MDLRPRRSALFLPASNPKAVAKARELDADVVILDLEDAVAPEAKDEARAAAVQAVRDGGFGRREVVIRVNGLDTAWGPADLAGTPRIARPCEVSHCRRAQHHSVGRAWISGWCCGGNRTAAVRSPSRPKATGARCLRGEASSAGS